MEDSSDCRRAGDVDGSAAGKVLPYTSEDSNNTSPMLHCPTSSVTKHKFKDNVENFKTETTEL